MEKIICKICGKEFDKNNALTLHLKKEHNISRKEYFDTEISYLKYKINVIKYYYELKVLMGDLTIKNLFN